MWNNVNPHSLLVGMQKGTSTWEDNLTVSYKVKHTLTKCSNGASWFYQGEEHVCPQKTWHVDGYSGFVYNWQLMEATKVFFAGQMDK